MPARPPARRPFPVRSRAPVTGPVVCGATAGVSVPTPLLCCGGAAAGGLVIVMVTSSRFAPPLLLATRTTIEPGVVPTVNTPVLALIEQPSRLVL